MPNNNTVASAYVQIVPSAQGIKGSITSALGGEADSAGSKLGSMLSTGIKAAVAAGVAGLGAIVGGALTEGGALQQSIGGVETLFGDSASRVISAAENAYRTAGVSANSYMEQVTSFSATLLQGLGGDTEAAAGYADKAIVQMADNANKMGTSMESIQYAYQGFAKDNYTMLDNLKLGYGGTQSEMARLINDSGVLGDSVKVTAETVKDVPFSSIIDAIQVIQDNLGITGTTAKEAATTLTGSFASVKAALSNVLAGLALGQDLGPALNGLASTLATFLTGNLIPAIYNILSALPSALVTFITALGPQLASGLSTIVPQIMTTGAQMLQSLSAGLVQGIPNFLAQALPLLLQFTTSLRANFSNIVDAGIDLLLNLVQGIANGLPSLIEYVPTIVSNIAGLINDNAPKILQAGIQVIFTLVQGLINAIPTIIANIPQIISAIADTITAFNWLNLGATVIKTLGNGLLSMAGSLKGFTQSTFSGALDYLKSLPGKALQWGKDLIGGFIDGIIGNVGNLINSVKNVAATIASYLHFSRPDVGPLRDYETWMPDMLSGMAQSIRSNIYRITDAMDFLGGSMRQTLPLDADGQAARALQQDAQFRREPRPAHQGRGGQAITLDEMTGLVTLIIQAIRENGGPIIIGDEIIGRANDRYRQDRAIITGGTA
ncbi:PblA [bacterium]|nr:PblA [bacterium]